MTILSTFPAREVHQSTPTRHAGMAQHTTQGTHGHIARPELAGPNIVARLMAPCALNEPVWDQWGRLSHRHHLLPPFQRLRGDLHILQKALSILFQITAFLLDPMTNQGVIDFQSLASPEVVLFHAPLLLFHGYLEIPLIDIEGPDTAAELLLQCGPEGLCIISTGFCIHAVSGGWFASGVSPAGWEVMFFTKCMTQPFDCESRFIYQLACFVELFIQVLNVGSPRLFNE